VHKYYYHGKLVSKKRIYLYILLKLSVSFDLRIIRSLSGVKAWH